MKSHKDIFDEDLELATWILRATQMNDNAAPEGTRFVATYVLTLCLRRLTPFVLPSKEGTQSMAVNNEWANELKGYVEKGVGIEIVIARYVCVSCKP